MKKRRRRRKEIERREVEYSEKYAVNTYWRRVRDAEELKKFQHSSKHVEKFLHGAQARCELSWKYRVFREKILLSREIFFLPLGSRVLIGQRNFEGIVFWERATAYMRECIYASWRRCYQEQGFAHLSLRKLRKSNERIGRSKTLRTMDGRGCFLHINYLRTYVRRIYLYIVDCSTSCLFLLLLQSLTRGFKNYRRLSISNSMRIFRWETEKCVVLSRQFLSRQREEFSWFILSDRWLNPVQLFSNWLGD